MEDGFACWLASVLNDYLLAGTELRAAPKPAAHDGLASCVMIDNGFAIRGTSRTWEHFFISFEEDEKLLPIDRLLNLVVERVVTGWKRLSR